MANWNPYKLKRPCANCPFLKDESKAISLHPERVPGIIEDLLSGRATGFSCHKTLNGEEVETDDGEYHYQRGGAELECAGAIAVMEKLGRPTQLMRIMERCGVYDPEKLKPIHDEVIDYVPR